MPGTSLTGKMAGCDTLWIVLGVLSRLGLRRNRSLQSRLAVRRRIDHLQAEDTADYIAFRLGRVGGKAELFGRDAVTLLHEAAGGSLRDLDRLATAALTIAAKTQQGRVGREVVQQVLAIDNHHRNWAS